MDILKKLPQELVNKVCLFYLEHPLAKILKQHLTIDDEDEDRMLVSIKYRYNIRWHVIYLQEDVQLSLEMDRMIKARKMDFSSENSYWHYIRDGEDYDDDGYSDDDSD